MPKQKYSCSNPKCDTVFSRYESAVTSAPYCSKKCGYAHRSEQAKENPKDRAERQCHNETCGKTFMALNVDINRGGAKYCCKECHYENTSRVNNKGLETRACPQCGTQFTKYRSQMTDLSCCSTSCGNTYRAQFGMVKKRRGVTKVCANPVCGNETYVNQAQHARGEGTYCSRECQMQDYNSNSYEIDCVYCNAPFKVWPSQVENGRIYCSRECGVLSTIARPENWLHNGRPAKRDERGYIFVWEPEHPNKSMKGWVAQHRLNYEKHIGRYLESTETLHHINFFEWDNRISNLQLVSNTEHKLLHWKITSMEREAMQWAADKSKSLEAKVAEQAELIAQLQSQLG